MRRNAWPESRGADGPLVGSGAEQRVALMAFDVEIQLVAPDLGEPRGHDDGAPGRARREMAHVDFIADGRVTFGQQAFYGAMTGDLHEADHGGCRKGTPASDVVREEIAVNQALEASFETGLNTFDRVQRIDCAQ